MPSGMLLASEVIHCTDREIGVERGATGLKARKLRPEVGGWMLHGTARRNPVHHGEEIGQPPTLLI